MRYTFSHTHTWIVFVNLSKRRTTLRVTEKTFQIFNNTKTNIISLLFAYFFFRFPENEDHRKKWLDAIGKTNAEVPAQSSLCSRHFSRSCFADSGLIDNAVPTLQLELYFSTEDDRSQEELKTELFAPITRPTVSK